MYYMYLSIKLKKKDILYSYKFLLLLTQERRKFNISNSMMRNHDKNKPFKKT